MTHFYGSTEQPKKIFGEGSIALDVFYEVLPEEATGACIAMDMLLDSWQSDVLVHQWTLPDGFVAVCPVEAKVGISVEVEALEGFHFNHNIKVNEPQEYGLSNAANIIHSIDGMIVREIQRRCNYERTLLEKWLFAIGFYCNDNNIKTANPDHTTFVSLQLVEDLEDGLVKLSEIHHLLPALLWLIRTSLEHQPFPVITVHDEFKCHPNNMNHLRQHYINIFYQLSRSNLLEDILTQIHGKPTKVQKLGDVSELILQSNYAIC